jgi:hypothetical protein
VTISPACLRDVSFIGAHMRPHDVRELMAQCPDDLTPQGAAVMCLELSQPDTAFVAYDRDRSPIAAYGFAPTFNPVVWNAWAFGTNGIRRAIPEISEHGLTVLFPYFFRKYRPKRVEIRSISDHDIAHRWLTGLGATHEATLTRYGKNGEDFELYVWTDKTIWPVYEKFQRRKLARRDPDPVPQANILVDIASSRPPSP